jgi:hypothetical protein
VEILDIIANLVTIVGLPLLIYTTYLLVKQLKLQTHQDVYQHIHAIDQYLVDNPSLRKYLYEGAALPKDDPHELSRVLAAADMMLTYFEHVLASKDGMSSEVREGFMAYMSDVCRSSPALLHFIEQKSLWYTEELNKLVRNNGNVSSQDQESKILTKES